MREARLSEYGAAVLLVVEETPGLHYRELMRRTHCESAGHIRHTVDRLKKIAGLQEYKDGKLVRFFPVGFAREAMPLRALLVREGTRKIILSLLSGPRGHEAIARGLSMSSSGTTYYLNILRKAGVVERVPAGWQLVHLEVVEAALR